MVDIRASCYAALLAAFSCPQKHCKALIFRGALKPVSGLIAGMNIIICPLSFFEKISR
jgi:hypothetical protein